ncbi:MAG: NADH:flavin oxidoreductase/NADH oxidase [Acidiferrobacterales bacterium]|nr:NADH:flavin oxidoreductase/NADH oxidase [Acidiferrobacterales bacterium]
MSQLFSPYRLCGIEFKNRIAVSPMSQYRALNGFANSWHLAHLGRFAMGGTALVFTEATAVTEDGRRTHGDLGIWLDEQAKALIPVAEFITSQKAVPGIQLAHAGRKASERRPWHGETPVDLEDEAQRNEAPWEAAAPSAIPYAESWPTPREMSSDEINATILAFGQAARRSIEAGFKIIEVYAAHGFLIHQFLSPIANHRSDEWGGSESNRRRFAIAVAEEIRKSIPESVPLSFRLSATDWLEEGIEVEQSVATAKALKDVGVDMIDCSTGGIGGKERPRRMVIEEGFQIPYSARIRKEAEMATMGVGFLWDAKRCEEIIANGSADMIALARELLDDPNWAFHAAKTLGVDQNYEMWPPESGWWLMKRDRLLNKLGIRS